jgi:hypothetical protein
MIVNEERHCPLKTRGIVDKYSTLFNLWQIFTVCIINMLLSQAIKIIGFLTLNPLGLWMLIVSCMRFDVKGIENKPLSHEFQNHFFVEKLIN